LNSTAKTILFWGTILATAVLLYGVAQHTASVREQVFPFSQFLQEIERGNVKEVTIAESDVKGKLANNQSFKTVLPMEYPELINMLRDKKVVITGERPTQSPWLVALVSWAPFLFLNRVLGVLYASDAARRQQRHVVRQEPGEAAHGTSKESHI